MSAAGAGTDGIKGIICGSDGTAHPQSGTLSTALVVTAPQGSHGEVTGGQVTEGHVTGGHTGTGTQVVASKGSAQELERIRSRMRPAKTGLTNKMVDSEVTTGTRTQ